MTFQELIPLVQIAVGPVILISGVGLLLLTMTNRLGRTIDRSRELVEARESADALESSQIQSQIDILWLRARIQRQAIIFGTLSALLAAVLMIVLFIGAVFQEGRPALLIAIFVGCLSSLIVSLVQLIRDINLSLHALALELHRPNGASAMPTASALS